VLYNQHQVDIYLTIRINNPRGDMPGATYRMQRGFEPETLPMVEVPLVDDLLSVGSHYVRIIQRKISGDAYVLMAEVEFEQPEEVKTRNQMEVFIRGKVQNFIDMGFSEIS
jgi:hypothetical protein